ncbi:MAG TPA: hypothetical protein VLL52_16340 [Anaerolineae bacterium]|nr:hypothetical protein [Anaerolineae bacterium]
MRFQKFILLLILLLVATACSSNDTQPTDTQSEPTIPSELGNIPAGKNEDGTFYLGSPSADIKFIDYSDFL